MDPDFPPWADCLDGESASPAKAIDRLSRLESEQIASKWKHQASANNGPRRRSADGKLWGRNNEFIAYGIETCKKVIETIYIDQ